MIEYHALSYCTENEQVAPILPLPLTAFAILFIEAGLTYWMPSLLSDPAGDGKAAATYMARFFFWFVIVRLTAAHRSLGFDIRFRCIWTGGYLLFAGPCIGRTVPLADTSFTGAFMGLIFPNAYAWMLTKGGGGDHRRQNSAERDHWCNIGPMAARMGITLPGPKCRALALSS